MTTLEELDRLFTLLLSSYRGLLASGRMGSMESLAETSVEGARTAISASALHAAVADLLRACSALRLEAAMVEVGAGGALPPRGAAWGDMTAERLAALLGGGALPGPLALVQCRELEQSATAVAVLGAGLEAPAQRLFLKRASTAFLADKAPASLPHHLRSFRVEHAFYSALREGGGAHHAALCAAGAPTPRCLATEEQAGDGGVFTLVTEHLDAGGGGGARYHEVRVCGREAAHAVLRWLAAFHAYWWQRPLQGLHRPGGWWRRALKPHLDFAALPRVFAAHCAAFPALGAALGTPANHARMQALAGQAEALHAQAASAPEVTLLHGDVKCSNAFFVRQRPAGSASASAPVLFDFQWCGSGSTGMADVAYFICGGVEAGEVLGSGCAALLRVYAEALQAGLAARGLAGEPLATLDACCEAFERELVVYYTLASPYLLAELTPEVLEGNRKKYGWLTHEQEEPMLWWLTSTVLGTLDKWGGAKPAKA